MIRVLLVDDSPTVRQILARELDRFDDIDVIGGAADAYEARELIVRHRPHVITLDLEMPRMDGLQFLAKLMQHQPTPVVVVSSMTPRDGELALRALQLGAIEVVGKPGLANSFPGVTDRLVQAIRTAAQARLALNGGAALPRTTIGSRPLARHLIALGASTGGTRAIETILRVLPAECPGLLIAQHLPAGFTEAFARRLDAVSRLHVREARDGDLITTGTALVAPGGRHMLLEREHTKVRVRVRDGDAVLFQKPSIDLLFHSIAETVGSDAVGVLLTGMGADGARGLLRMRECGAFTIAEAESSCVVYGMPREAVACGAAAISTPLPRIAEQILNQLLPAKHGEVCGA